MADDEYEPDYDEGDFGGDDMDGEDIEEPGEEVGGGMENIDVSPIYSCGFGSLLVGRSRLQISYLKWNRIRYFFLNVKQTIKSPVTTVPGQTRSVGTSVGTGTYCS